MSKRIHTRYRDNPLEVDKHGIRWRRSDGMVISAKWGEIYRVVLLRSFRPWVKLVRIFSTNKEGNTAFFPLYAQVKVFFRLAESKRLLQLSCGLMNIDEDCKSRKWVGDFSPLAYDRALTNVVNVMLTYVPQEIVQERSFALGILMGLFDFFLQIKSRGSLPT